MHKKLIVEYKESLKKAFGSAAEDYHLRALFQKEVAYDLCCILPISKYKEKQHTYKILEIGCGSGFLTEYLLTSFPNAHLWITDLSADMLNACKQNMRSFEHCNITYKLLDGENLNSSFAANHQFDLIVSNMAFQWFRDADASIEQIMSYLKEDGALYYAMSSHNHFWEWYESAKQVGLINGYKKIIPAGILMQKVQKINYGNTLNFLKYMSQTGINQYTPNVYLDASSKNCVYKVRSALKLCDAMHKGFITWHAAICSLNF
ncbi:MAG: methyltransferase domain-containing protein [Proteobacteria bacterium]|nr:methyltransferase domain-containing protein [Pseudomonadota bacterium]